MQQIRMLQQGESGIAGGNIRTLVLFILQISRDSTPFIEYHPFQLSAYSVALDAYIYPASIYLSTLLLQGCFVGGHRTEALPRSGM
jgi:hypothetical protein